MRLFLIIITIIVLITLPIVSNGSDTVFAGYHYSYDTDYAKINEYYAGYHKLFDQGQFAGFQLGAGTFKDTNGTEDFEFIRLEGRKNLSESLYVQGGIRYNISDEWSPLTGDVSAVWTHTPYRLEVFYERSIVDSIRAINSEIISNTFGVSLDYSLTDEWLLTGVLYYQDITDGNGRTGETIQLTYSPKRIEGFYTKLRGKFRQSDFNPPEYFAPQTYERYDLLFGYKRSFDSDNWVGYVEAGPGIQVIENISEFAYEYKVGVYGWITQSWKLNAFYGGTTDGGEEDYTYNWGGVQLNYYW